MAVALRPIALVDVPQAGRVCHDAFKAIAEQHNFPPDFPDPDVAIDLVSKLSAHPGFYGVIAEEDGRIVGSNFVDERSPIVGLGPITVDPAAQNRGVGAALMAHMIERTIRRLAPGLRLVQSGYHTRSLCLYTKLGFVVREHLTNLQGPAIGISIPGYTVRPATVTDAEACNRLCRAVHGHERVAAICAMRSSSGPHPLSSATGGSPATRRRSPFSATPSPKPTRILRH